jgi:hypothetical protein
MHLKRFGRLRRWLLCIRTLDKYGKRITTSNKYFLPRVAAMPEEVFVEVFCCPACLSAHELCTQEIPEKAGRVITFAFAIRKIG